MENAKLAAKAAGNYKLGDFESLAKMNRYLERKIQIESDLEYKSRTLDMDGSERRSVEEDLMIARSIVRSAVRKICEKTTE